MAMLSPNTFAELRAQIEQSEGVRVEFKTNFENEAINALLLSPSNKPVNQHNLKTPQPQSPRPARGERVRERGSLPLKGRAGVGMGAWHKNTNCSKIKNNRSFFEIKMDATANTLFGKTRQAVLTLLFEQPTERFYLREIAKITNISSGALQKELGQLHAADLVMRAEDGNRVTYQANSQHPIFGELQSIIAKTCGLPEQLKAALAPLVSGIKFAAIYGSFAKGGNHARSDIDLLLVGQSTMESIINLIQPLEEQFSREISLRLYVEEDFKKRRTQGDSFLSSIIAGPMIPLIGTLNDA